MTVIANFEERLFWSYIFCKPILCGIKITDRCNLRCIHCPFQKMEENDLSTDTWRQIFIELEEMGVVFLTIEGGEPFLREDLDELIRYAKSRFLVGVVTNGTMPIETVADIVWVSIDGLEKTHNKIRGGGVFQKALGNVRASSHRNVHANVTVNRLNYIEIPELITKYQDFFKGFSIEFHYPYHGYERLMLDWTKRRDLCTRLIKMKEDGFPIDNSIDGLEALATNTWVKHCVEWANINVDPDGTVLKGCYIRNGLGERNCYRCGYHCYCELTLALEGNKDATKALVKLLEGICKLRDVKSRCLGQHCTESKLVLQHKAPFFY